MEEIWKDIDGFEGYYQISSFGRVKSYKRKNPIILSPGVNTHGYERVCLVKGDDRKNISIHRLVALAFLPNPDNKPEVNHKDENKRNNRVDNLEWVTSTENKQWGTSLSRRAYTQRSTQTTKAVYQYDKSLNLINVFPSRNEAARILGIERSGIGHCCHNRKGFETYKGFIWRYENTDRDREIAETKYPKET